MAAKHRKLQLEIAQRLWLLRIALYDNASDMARSISLTPQAWYNYETGRRALDAGIAAVVVEEHGVDFNWLYGGQLHGVKPKLRKILFRELAVFETNWNAALARKRARKPRKKRAAKAGSAKKLGRASVEVSEQQRSGIKAA